MSVFQGVVKKKHQTTTEWIMVVFKSAVLKRLLSEEYICCRILLEFMPIYTGSWESLCALRPRDVDLVVSIAHVRLMN
jgi:hypothetical protein